MIVDQKCLFEPVKTCTVAIGCEYVLNDSNAQRIRAMHLMPGGAPPTDTSDPRLAVAFAKHCYIAIHDQCNDPPSFEQWELSAGSAPMVRDTSGVSGKDPKTVIFSMKYDCDGNAVCDPGGGKSSNSQSQDGGKSESKCDCVRRASEGYGLQGGPQQYGAVDLSGSPSNFGPNSNTFVAAVSEICGFDVSFPPQAWGHDWTSTVERDGESVPRDELPRDDSDRARVPEWDSPTGMDPPGSWQPYPQ